MFVLLGTFSFSVRFEHVCVCIIGTRAFKYYYYYLRFISPKREISPTCSSMSLVFPTCAVHKTVFGPGKWVRTQTVYVYTYADHLQVQYTYKHIIAFGPVESTRRSLSRLICPFVRGQPSVRRRYDNGIMSFARRARHMCGRFAYDTRRTRPQCATDRPAARNAAGACDVNTATVVGGKRVTRLSLDTVTGESVDTSRRRSGKTQKKKKRIIRGQLSSRWKNRKKKNPHVRSFRRSMITASYNYDAFAGYTCTNAFHSFQFSLRCPYKERIQRDTLIFVHKGKFSSDAKSRFVGAYNVPGRRN